MKPQLKPERKSTKSPEQAIIIAVPRSGCLNTTKKQLNMINKLMNISFLCIGSFLLNKKLAKNMGTANFNSSED